MRSRRLSQPSSAEMAILKLLLWKLQLLKRGRRWKCKKWKDCRCFTRRQRPITLVSHDPFPSHTHIHCVTPSHAHTLTSSLAYPTNRSHTLSLHGSYSNLTVTTYRIDETHTHAHITHDTHERCIEAKFKYLVTLNV